MSTQDRERQHQFEQKPRLPWREKIVPTLQAGLEAAIPELPFGKAVLAMWRKWKE